jgi:hypothetical protein
MSEPTPAPFCPGEHKLEVRTMGLFGGAVDAEVVSVSESFIIFRTPKPLKFGSRLRFALTSQKHQDRLEGVALVSKVQPAEFGHAVEMVVEKKSKDHDTTIRAMRSWYTSERYKARESTHRLRAEGLKKDAPPRT